MKHFNKFLSIVLVIVISVSLFSFSSYAAAEQVLLANNLDFSAYVKRDMQIDVIDGIYKSTVNGRPDYVRFFIPKDVWLDNIQSENQHNLTKITLSTSGYFDIQVDKEYNLTTTYDYSAQLTTNVRLYVSVWYSGGIYKTIELYNSSYVPSSGWRVNHNIDINFKLDSSKFPETGYKCKFYLDFEQSYGNIYLSSDPFFGVSDIHLTNLDDNSGWFQKIIDAITSIPSKISSFFTNLGSTIGNFFSDLWEKLRTQFENIGKWFKELGDKIGQFFVDLGEDIKGFFEMLKNYLLYFQHPVTVNSDGVPINDKTGKPVYTNPFSSKLKEILNKLEEWTESINGFIDSMDSARDNVTSYMDSGKELIDGVIKGVPILAAVLIFVAGFYVVRKVVGQ